MSSHYDCYSIEVVTGVMIAMHEGTHKTAGLCIEFSLLIGLEYNVEPPNKNDVPIRTSYLYQF